jgi:hypothetical protein
MNCVRCGIGAGRETVVLPRDGVAPCLGVAIILVFLTVALRGLSR